jgi:hypothetical protein
VAVFKAVEAAAQQTEKQNTAPAASATSAFARSKVDVHALHFVIGRRCHTFILCSWRATLSGIYAYFCV